MSEKIVSEPSKFPDIPLKTSNQPWIHELAQWLIDFKAWIISGNKRYTSLHLIKSEKSPFRTQIFASGFQAGYLKRGKEIMKVFEMKETTPE